jgi:hypothetical protein
MAVALVKFCARMVNESRKGSSSSSAAHEAHRSVLSHEEPNILLYKSDGDRVYMMDLCRNLGLQLF